MGGGESNPISGAVIETFNILYLNVILDLRKVPRLTVLVFLFAPVYVLAWTMKKLKVRHTYTLKKFVQEL